MGRMSRFRSLLVVLALFSAAPASALAEPPPKTAAELSDELMVRLAKTTDEDEAAGLVKALGELSMRSGSDAGDLLVSRALAAFAAENFQLSRELLDAVVAVQPEWAEGWNKRASVRFASGDIEGAAADVAQTLKRNPRHIGALLGLAEIFDAAGRREDALKIYERALALAPAFKPAREAAKQLAAEIAGTAL